MSTSLNTESLKAAHASRGVVVEAVVASTDTTSQLVAKEQTEVQAAEAQLKAFHAEAEKLKTLADSNPVAAKETYATTEQECLQLVLQVDQRIRDLQTANTAQQQTIGELEQMKADLQQQIARLIALSSPVKVQQRQVDAAVV